MSPDPASPVCQWFCAGDEFFLAQLAAIDAARASVSLEIYTLSDGHLGRRFRDALIRARQRGARVRVLVDAVGSYELPTNFWAPLTGVGGEVRWFNPLTLRRVWIRNHRKLLTCDDRHAFIGGFNIADEYEGDGVTRGWRDLGLRVEGPLVKELALSFEEMLARAEFRHQNFPRLRKSTAKKSVATPGAELIFSGPGRGPNPIKRALRADLARARDVQIMAAYFLPSWRLRRDLLRVARRGGRVQLILAGQSDVRLSQLAGRSLYRRLLRGGVEIFEYQPQVLHAKLMIIDGAAYAGSANLDQRSLVINYELMLRLPGDGAARQAREIFAENLQHCRPIRPEEWRRSSTFWRRLQQRLAYWVLVRLDPWVARWQWRSLPK